MPEKKYKHIEILEEGDIISNKIRIIYEDGSIEVVEASPEKRDNFNECYDHFINFGKQEGFVDELGIVDLSNFLKSGCVTKKLTEKKAKAKKENKEKETNVTKKENKEKESKEKEDNGTKKKTAVKIGAICLGALLLLSGGYVLANHINNKNNKDNNSNNSNNNKPSNSFVQIITKPEEDIMTFEEKLNEISENSDKIVSELTNMVNGKLQSSEELDKCLENIANASLANMTEISNYVTGSTSTIEGNVASVNFVEPFDKNTVDFNAVNYFNNLRNNVIDAAYTKKSVNETKKCVDNFNKAFVEFVFGDKALPCEFNGIKARYIFEDLNPSAKMTILLMGMNMLNIEQDFIIKIDDVEYNRIVAIEESYKLNQSVYQDLVKTQQYTKTK